MNTQAPMKRASHLALLALVPLTGLLFLSQVGRHSARMITGDRVTGQGITGQAEPRRKANIMPNQQITIGGPAVNVPMATAGSGPGGPVASPYFQIVNAAGTVIVPPQSPPASGASITVANLVISNTGTTVVFGGNTYAVLSIQSLAGATAGTGFALVETPGAVNANAYSLFDVAAPAAPPTPAAPAKEQHFFSTGTLSATYLDRNTGLPATAPFGQVQGIDFNWDWAAQDLHDAAQVSVFPVDVAFHDGKFLIKAQHVGVTADQLCFLAGLQLNVTANPVIETINAVSFPQRASLAFTGQDSKGRNIVVTLTNVVAKGFSLPFKLSDWAMSDVEFHAIKDANGVIGTIAMAQ